MFFLNQDKLMMVKSTDSTGSLVISVSQLLYVQPSVISDWWLFDLGYVGLNYVKIIVIHQLSTFVQFDEAVKYSLSVTNKFCSYDLH